VLHPSHTRSVTLTSVSIVLTSRRRMVAVAVPQGLTADLFLQMTTQAETSVSGYQAVSLCLELDNKSSLAVQLIFCPNWPHLSVPVSNCVHLVDCLTRLAQPDKPAVVIDSFGATEAAIFIVLSSLVRQMDLEDNVDVFHWFKCVHLCRPGIWVSPDNLLFLYRVMAELCSIKRASQPSGTRVMASSGELNI